MLKKPESQIYAVSGMKRNVKISLSTRDSENSSFCPIYSTVHMTSRCALDNKGIYTAENLALGDRPSIPFSDQSQAFLFKQDLVKILGHCNFESLVRQSSIQSPSKSAHVQERDKKKEKICPEKFFDYSIAESN